MHLKVTLEVKDNEENPLPEGLELKDDRITDDATGEISQEEKRHESSSTNGFMFWSLSLQQK